MSLIGRAASTLIVMAMSMKPVTSDAGDGGAAWCERQWRIESGKVAQDDPASRQALLARWETYRGRCSGTVVYEARLAIAHALAGQHDRAAEVLQPLNGTATRHRDLLEFAGLQIDFFKVFAPGKTTPEGIRGLEAKFRAFATKHPEFLEGHLMLGGLQTILGMHVEAIASHAAEQALLRNRALANDQRLVFALARADGALGNFKDAEAELRAIARKGARSYGTPSSRRRLSSFGLASPRRGPARNRSGRARSRPVPAPCDAGEKRRR